MFFDPYVFFGIKKYRTTRRGALFFDALYLRIPFINTLLIQTQAARSLGDCNCKPKQEKTPVEAIVRIEETDREQESLTGSLITENE